MKLHFGLSELLTATAALLVLACGEDTDKSTKDKTCPALTTSGTDPGTDECPDSGTGSGGAAGSGGMAGSGGSGTSGSGGMAGGGAGMAGMAGMAGTAGMAGGGGSSGGPVDYCMIGQCPTNVDVGLTPDPNNTYRWENGGPYANIGDPPPAGAICWCVINEFDDFTCTSDAECDLGTCDTSAGTCNKPGQHTHGPFDASIDPNTADGTGMSMWGNHVGPGCPYFHLHGLFTSPMDTGGVTDPPDQDLHPSTCGHGGLIWLGANGIIYGP